MMPSSRTPEGQPNCCPVCGKDVCIEPSVPPGDAPCPHCGHLLWFEPTVPKETRPDIRREILREIQPCLRQAGDIASDLAAWEASQGHHDEADRLFVESIVYDPGNLTYVGRYHAFLESRYADKKKSGPLAYFRQFRARLLLRRAIARRKWNDAIALGLAVLRTNPWDVPTLVAMATASAGSGLDQCELYYLKWAQGVAPNDPEVNRLCNRALIEHGQYDKAVALLRRRSEGTS